MKKQSTLNPLGIVLILIGMAVFAIYFFPQSMSVDIEIRDDPPWFFPAALEIEPGTKVIWHLLTHAVHPVMTLEEPHGAESIHSGHFTKTWSYTFTKPGLYVYICPIHPYMKGVIGVGQKVPKDKIPPWAEWPPAYKDPSSGLPSEQGKGKIWLAAQFHKPLGKNKPGTLILINAETWEIEKIIDDSRLVHPHNLWEYDGKILVTNWFDKHLSVFDKVSGQYSKTILLGESPAHVQSSENNKIYVTVQGENEIAVLDSNFEETKRLVTPTGPHGHWMASGLMAVASTEKGKISVWNTETDSLLFESFLEEDQMVEGKEEGEEHEHTLPLMAGLTLDGKYAYIAASGTGKFYVFDVEKKEKIKSIYLGPTPIQTVPSPDGKYILVPLTGSGEVAVISTENWELETKIKDVGAGAHGVYFGEKQNGGWYAYISNKFVTWVTVIDMDTLQIAGYIPLPKDAWGGQGILVTD